MNRKSSAALLLCLLLLLPVPIRAAPGISKAEIVIEQSTQRVLLGENTTSRLPMASTTKIMTALIALEQGDLSDLVTVSDNAAGTEGSSLYLQAGEVLSLEDLLFGLMIRSGNDAALAIAEHISGSEAAFVEKMNERAREIGAMNTHFANPHGLPEEDHYTTAYDLALIAAQAYDTPGFERFASALTYRIPATNLSPPRTLKTKNKLLTSFEGCVGGKIGYTQKAGRCLVSSARREGMQLICVVLSCYEMFDRSAALLEQGFTHYAMMDPLTVPVYVPVQKSRTGQALARAEGLKVPLSETERELCTVRLETEKNLTAPLLPGDRAGRAVIYLCGEEIAARELLICEEVRADTYSAVLGRVLSGFIWKNKITVCRDCKNTCHPAG